MGPDFASYDFDDWCDLPPRAGELVVRTPTRLIPVPRVIQLVHYDRLPSREVRFTRRNIFYRDKCRCQYCGKVFPQRELNLDHVVPLSQGGASHWENVVCACIRCNTSGRRATPMLAMRMKPTPPASSTVATTARITGPLARGGACARGTWRRRRWTRN